MIVAVHQPNYWPWLGYFAKAAQADCFVLLDDVQFSKGSYTNRVRIARGGEQVWLTEPVRHRSGAAIKDIEISRPDFAAAHLDTLRQAYRHANAFTTTWRWVEAVLTAVPSQGLADINAQIIAACCAHLGIAPRIVRSSGLGVAPAPADERLAAIVARLAPGGTYLSGAGGAGYQAEATFAARGVRLVYSRFQPGGYARSGEAHLGGLSVLDALFHLGREETASLIRNGIASSAEQERPA